MPREAKKRADVAGIRFPVLRKLIVAGYELYPGTSRGGIKHDFHDGVTVIAGVNGLGKTTLLNVILRLLVGPLDPKKASNFEPGVSSQELIRWRDQQYFSSRVGDGAENASAEAVFHFGERRLSIARSLQNLALLALTVDGEELPLDEDRYGEAAVLLSGVASRYDFDFIVRHLVFFLERRVPLFWNESGQFEIFRMLFFDRPLAERLGNLAAEIRVEDSHFRNMRWSFNRREKAYAEAKQKAGQVVHDQAQLAALESAIKATEEARTKSSEELLRMIERRKQTITNLDQRRLQLEDLVRELQTSRQRFFARIFPDMPKAAEYVLGQLASGGGCLVCGNRRASSANRVRKLMKDNVCPVCESPPEIQEKIIPVGAVDAARIAQMEQQENKRQVEISSLEKLLAANDREIQEILEYRAAEDTQSVALVRQAEEIKARLLASPLEEDGIDRELRKDREELSALRVELFKKRSQYEDQLEKARSRMQELAEDLKSAFERYASTFMAETCRLDYDPAEIKIGQEGDTFRCPNFKLLMTSATSTSVGAPRSDPDDVSESQREFIDLAFRMALMITATGGTSASMLVVETPESSLDSVFVEHAGALLRQFTKRTSTSKGNVLVASSNLNRENMIPALLGFDDKPAEERRKIARRSMINLLELAAPNAAMRSFGPEYRRDLELMFNARQRNGSRPVK